LLKFGVTIALRCY